MKLTTIQAAVGSAFALLSAQSAEATTQHRHHHLFKRHGHTHSARETKALEERGGKCKFPDNAGLVAITPNALNAGWAMSPDQPCKPGMYCPIACPPGKVMAQWRKGSKYTYPESMDGGLYCDDDGNVKKPLDDQPYCVDGSGAVQVVNKAGSVVSFCQTVLPGNEDMIIPNDIFDVETIAVPAPSYWCETAAHYYINPPGVSASEGCHWGSEAKPVGNWSPFVAGANTDKGGQTFVKLGYNPIWQSSPLSGTKPTFGVKIECPDGGCNGLPCAIDPSKGSSGSVISALSATGAGGADFCVVTVPKGKTANIVVFNTDGSTGGASSKSSQSQSKETPKPSTSAPAPTSSAAPTTSSTTSSTAAPTSTSTSTSTSSSSPSSSSVKPTSTSTTSILPSSSPAPSGAIIGQIFQENGTSTTSFAWASPSTTAASSSSHDATSPSPSNKNEGIRQGSSAMAGLIVALIAAGYLL